MGRTARPLPRAWASTVKAAADPEERACWSTFTIRSSLSAFKLLPLDAGVGSFAGAAFRRMRAAIAKGSHFSSSSARLTCGCSSHAAAWVQRDMHVGWDSLA
jgi:hypothetical protein